MSKDETTKVLEEGSEDDFDRFLAALDPTGNFKVKLYRYDPKTSRPVYVGTFTSELELEDVRKAYGGGRFQFRVEERTRDGLEYRGSRTVEIAGPFRDLTRDDELEEDEDEERDELERLRKRERELERELETQRIEQRFDSFRREILDVVRELKNPPSAAENADPVKMAMSIVEQVTSRLAPHVRTPPPSMSSAEILDIIRLGMEMGAGGGGADEGPYTRILDRLAPALNRLLAPGAELGQPLLDNPPSEDAFPEQGSEPMTLKTALRTYVPHIAAWAAEGKRPDLRAELVLEELPDYWLEKLDAFLEEQAGSAVTTLLQWYPELTVHRTWLEAFVEALRPEDEEEDDPPGVELGTLEEGGNGVQVPDDADVDSAD